MEWGNSDVGSPDSGQVRIRQTAVGQRVAYAPMLDAYAE